jgi:Protein of unknown function (DUF4241)
VNTAEWPNNPSWSALREGFAFEGNDFKGITTVTDAGILALPSGRLVIYDPASLKDRYSEPFYRYAKNDEKYYLIRSGEYPVVLTQVKATLHGGRILLRNAYASIILQKNSSEITRKLLTPIIDGKPPLKDLPSGQFYDANTEVSMLCVVDETLLLQGMPSIGSQTELESWFDIYLEDWIEVTLASNQEFSYVELPKSCEKMLIVQTGWGDGGYPVIGGFDQNGQLIAIHIDFFVCPTDR